jgi:protein-disulfide isomerase
LIVAIVVLSASGAPAQDVANTFTLNPIMSRGPATAPVTIVEFSDYQ